MTRAQAREPVLREPLRLWPGVVIVVVQWLVRIVVPRVTHEPTALALGLLGGVFGGALAVLVWWVFFSRAPRLDRWGALALIVVAMAVTPRFLHESVRTGNAGLQFYFQATPVVSLALVAWAVASRRLADRPRRATMVATILLACGIFTLLRSDGITGEGNPQFAWRWSPTDEERLLDQASDEPIALAASALEAPHTEIGWPGLGGPDRDVTVPGVRLETDWSRSPPVELWRRPIGPGVSSFAARGDLLYTQEQRGEDEIVACYRVTTGEPVWRHHDKTRFWDSYVGAGPRATPTLSEDRIYTFGATGILNALDARDGTLVWSRDAAADTGAELPFWGFVSSPLVIDDLVIVHTDALVAYEAATGEQRWIGEAVGETYSSPHLLTLDGVEQILLMTQVGAQSVAPADGKVLWENPWPGIGIMQPTLTADGDLLIVMTSEMAIPIGTRRIAVTHEAGRWTLAELWTSDRLKPSFSPMVVHQGQAFGFDGSILASIDVETGERSWKGGRFGSGQLLLLPDQDLLLILSERGELALVEAAPDKFRELARFPAIEGKTWTQPALVGDVLLVRNSQEMAAFRLALAGG